MKISILIGLIVANCSTALHAAESNAITGTQQVTFHGGTNNRYIGINNGTVNTYLNASNVTFVIVGTNIPPVPFPKNVTGKLAELKRVAETREFGDVMGPFITPGLGQPLNISNYKRENTKRPVSYQALFQYGALGDDLEAQHRLVAFGIKPGLERPKWPMKHSSIPSWQNNSSHRTIVEKAQAYFREYGKEMVDLGLLSP